MSPHHPRRWWGFFCGPTAGGEMAADEARQYLRNGGEVAPAPAEALEWGRDVEAKMVDLKFCDLLGSWQHVTLPLSAFGESAFDEGLGFDGSSIRGWQGISESDMLLMPQAETAVLDPFAAEATLSLVCEVVDPLTREPYGKDPRRVARRAEEHLRATGIADTAYFGPECEFFVFDSVSHELADNRAHYEVDSGEGHWNAGRPGLGYTVRPKEGYFPPAPTDTLSDLRTEMVLTLERLGIPCEFHHHEVASGGQCEIDLRFASLTQMADQVLAYKYVVRNVARRHGKTATFMPKPIFGDNGSGMHCHQSLWLEGEPLMADAAGYAGLSPLARSYVGGLLAHAPALLAFCAPTTNPYLAFSAMLLAGLDGIERGLDPGAPADYDLFEDAGHDVPQVPGSLPEALDALAADHEFLLAGGVFSEELIRTWIAWKREHEVDVVRLRPHPAEFGLYFDA